MGTNHRSKHSRQPTNRPTPLSVVAKQSGFSPATVSRAFNQPNLLSPETRDRILQVAASLKYRPNRLVNGVIYGRVPIIGVVMNSLKASFMSELLGGIFKSSASHDYSCLIYDAVRDVAKEVNALRQCLEHRLSGIIYYPTDLASQEKTEILAEIDDLGIPMVYLMDSAQHGGESPLVANDDFKGAFSAVSHLIELGHRKILHLMGTHTGYRTSDERLRGYLEAHASAGLKVIKSLLKPGGFGPAEQTERILAQLESQAGGRPYTAIFAAGDHAAMSAIRFFQRKGVRVPEEVSVVGFGDLEASDRISPALTTVNQNFEELGLRAAEICIRGAKREPLDPDLLQAVPVRLIVRESSGPPPKTTGASAPRSKAGRARKTNR